MLTAYPDPGSGGAPWTIGIGHTAAAGPPAVRRSDVITRDEALAILATDLGKYEAAVAGAAKGTLSQPQFDALVSLCFNIGPGNFRGSSLVRHLNTGRRAAAANDFLSWTRAAGHVMAGLVTRRRDERALFLESAAALPVVANDNGEATGIMLRRGSPYPDAVRALQSDLKTLGYAVGVDGDCGARTEAAVIAFQRSRGLASDGKAGPATRSAIAAAIKARGGTIAVAMHPLPGQAITAIVA